MVALTRQSGDLLAFHAPRGIWAKAEGVANQPSPLFRAEFHSTLGHRLYEEAFANPVADHPAENRTDPQSR